MTTTRRIPFVQASRQRASLAVVAGLAAGLISHVAVADAQSLRAAERIGTSHGGRAIEVYSLGVATPDGHARDKHARPAIAVIAGLDGRHTAGPKIARAIARVIERDHAAMLENRTVYVIPMVNPDGQGSPTGRNVLAFDADRDGRINEDGAEDLNGDGFITMMRVRRPSSSTGLEATMVADLGEPRLLRAPDASKNEVAEFAVLTEGRDNDGDGRFNEDGPNGEGGGGVVLDHQFTAFWPEHNEAAGRYPLSEPESRAIADWLLERDNIQAVYVLTVSDTLLNTPPKGSFDESGRMPVGLESDDEAWHKMIGDAFTTATKERKGPTGDHRGALRTWAYAELGLWSFSHPGWTRPEPVKSGGDAETMAEVNEAEAKVDAVAPEASDLAAELRERGVPADMIAFLSAGPEERQAMMADFENSSSEERQARMAQIQMLPADLRARVFAIAQGQPDPAAAEIEAQTQTESTSTAKSGESEDDTAWTKTEDGKWLTYSTDVRAGTGFLDWTPFDHPQLGQVEIGGFVPGFKFNPPDAEIDAIGVAQATFVARVAGMLADVTIPKPEAERVGPGLWRVRVSIENTGKLPTASAIARKARRLPPELLVLEAPPEVILSGSRIQRFDSIPGGDRESAEWLITARDGSSVNVTLRSARFGDRVVRVGLVEDE